MKTDVKRRTIWCDSCDTPQEHLIEYKGTVHEDGKPMAKFKATCTRCEARKFDKSDDVSKMHTVSIVSWNALVQKELYASTSAP